MTQTVTRDAIPGGVPGGQPAPATRTADAWHLVAGWLDTVPGWAWLTLAALLFAGLLVLRIRLGKAYRTNPPKTGDNLGGLFVAAVVLAGGLWACILAASGKNLLGFARDTIHWTGGAEWLIIAGLDGTAVAFAMLMFAAVQAGRPANRAYRIVWSSTLMSMVIGFVHGYGEAGSMAAAALLGYFALASMGVLHELLDLFRSTTTKRAPRLRPPFGLRWVTYFPNTVCAALAWENHPPRPLPPNATDEQVVWYGSVRHAVAHLNVVRRAKRIARYEVDRYAGQAPAAGWARVVPWLRVRELTAALADVREKAVAELARVTAQAAADRHQAAATIADLRRELTAVTADATDVRRRLADEQAARQVDADRLARERQEAVSRVLANAQAAGRQASGRTARQAAGDRPQTDRQAAGRPGEPSSPPWSDRQVEAFKLRDADPKTWSWPALAAHFDVAQSTVRSWFDHRRKHQAASTATPAVPTVQIASPTPPVVSGVNGTAHTH